ncbi:MULTISPECIES: hypothetical protein [unclassified Endozoicomonas]|uniref:hypothetical protein n=1 Tax=unclassified Endozoicomonas TaxID=2644528 RepID=UPI0021482821|nr:MULTISPECIES: hypothetical protein [unclassified Endozoicomonas]
MARDCIDNRVYIYLNSSNGLRIGEMNKQQLEAFDSEAAKSIKTEDDLNDCRQMLSKVTI